MGGILKMADCLGADIAVGDFVQVFDLRVNDECDQAAARTFAMICPRSLYPVVALERHGAHTYAAVSIACGQMAIMLSGSRLRWAHTPNMGLIVGLTAPQDPA